MKPYITALIKVSLITAVSIMVFGCSDGNKNSKSRSLDTISPEAFINPPLEARPGAYWCWLNGTVDLEQMTREMEEAKALGMRGFEIWDIGVYRPVGMIPAGPAFLGEESLKSIKHAMTEADRLGLELNLIAASSWNAGGAWVKKSDGSKRIESSSLAVSGPQQFEDVLSLPCDKETYYSDISVLAVPQSKDKKLASPDLGIDLTNKMDNTGRLKWDVPEGNWTIMRFVCRGTNQRLIVPSPNSDGLLIDHLSAEATERHMMHMINKLGEIDPGHKIIKIMSHDSYEVHAANDWTEDFVDEFKRRRGYDPEKYMPLLEGWTLADKEIQTRFIADYRKTVGELLVERHFRVSREVLNRYGMKLCAEAGHGGFARVDPIWALGQADIPRGEFWNGKRFWVTKEAASAANLYGRRFVDSESFTGWRNWLDGPLHYKQLFDVAICAGLNRLTFHTFAHNPPEAGLPGYVYHAGEHFNANNTWWKQSGPMLLYMSRCSYMMQQGNFVADVCFYYGDQAPNLVPSRRIDPNITPLYTLDKCLHCGRPVPIDFRQLGSGYDYDYIDANSILNRMKVDPESGQLVVNNMRYRVMVLPKQEFINLDVLKRIRDLVQEGAAILGPEQPVRTNSLTDYPEADQKVAQIGTELWGAENSDEETASRHMKFGKGKVFTNLTLRQMLAEMGVTPDFIVLKGGTQEGPERVDYIHRRTDNADVYFICNGALETKTLLCRFRDGEGRPEIWYPVTGEICSPKAFTRQPDNSCNIELELPAFGSAFVVFRRDGHPPENPAPIFSETSIDKTTIKGKWKVKFQPGRFAPESVEWDELIDWTSSEEPGVRYFSGTATYFMQFEMLEIPKTDFWLDLGKVNEVGEVYVDGHNLGTVWTFPFRVKVPANLLSQGSHLLEVKVTNVWNNRLVGDQFLPEEERFTRTNMKGQHTKSSPLVPSGLMGPVTLQPIQEIEDGFVAYSAGRAEIPPVGELSFKEPPGDVHIKYGYLFDDDFYAIKIASGFFGSPPSNRYTSDGLILLFKKGTGELACALLDECLLTNVRTAAAGAVSAKYLAPKNVECIGILGAGTQGRMQVEYLAPVIDCKEVLVWGMNQNELDDYKKVTLPMIDFVFFDEIVSA